MMLLYCLRELLVLQSEALGRRMIRDILVIIGLHGIELLLGGNQTVWHDLSRSLSIILMCSVLKAIGLMQVTQ